MICLIITTISFKICISILHKKECESLLVCSSSQNIMLNVFNTKRVLSKLKVDEIWWEDRSSDKVNIPLLRILLNIISTEIIGI